MFRMFSVSGPLSGPDTLHNLLRIVFVLCCKPIRDSDAQNLQNTRKFLDNQGT